MSRKSDWRFSETTLKGKGRKKWVLHCILRGYDEDEENVVSELQKLVCFRANSMKQIFYIVLKVLRETAKRVKRVKAGKRQKVFGMVELRPSPKPDSIPISECDIYRLKNKYHTPDDILEISLLDIRECFVRGLGSKALEELDKP